MRVEYVKLAYGTFKLDEDGNKIDLEINDPFRYKTQLLTKLFKIYVMKIQKEPS